MKEFLDRGGLLRPNSGMLPRFWLAIFWFGAAASAHAADRSAWAELADSSPVGWGLIVILAILATALATHLLFMLAEGRLAPAELTGALERTIAAGNYQEAWAACADRPQAHLARLLRPALERIGQGHEPVEAHLSNAATRERRMLALLCRALLGAGVAAVLVGMIACIVRLATTAPGPRGSALALGDTAMLAAAALGVATAAGIFGVWLLRRGRREFATAEEWAAQLLATLPYEEIAGLRIGRDFDAGSLLDGGEPIAQTTGRLTVSRALTSTCPSCNSPINPTHRACPHCGKPLEWT
jgi:positive regulator of sigma E activity